MSKNKVQQTARRVSSSVYGDMSPRRKAIYFAEKPVQSPDSNTVQETPISAEGDGLLPKTSHQAFVKKLFSPKESREMIRRLKSIEGVLGVSEYMNYRRKKLKRKQQIQRAEAYRLFIEENPDADVEPPPEIMSIPVKPTMSFEMEEIKKARRQQAKEIMKKFEQMVDSAAI